MTMLSRVSTARAELASVPSRDRLKKLVSSPGVLAVAAWLICLPGALALPSIIDRSPFSLRGSASPIVAGAIALAALVLASRRWRGGAVAGVAAGIFAAWVVLTLHTAVYGTPLGFGGITGDPGRLSAMAERYTITLHSADGIVASVPAEWPPLFPWLIGRVSVLAGVPAWRLLGAGETLLISSGILASFLLWRRLVSDGIALALTLVTILVFVEPDKPYEVITLSVLAPWVLQTFADPPRGRLHWLPAGLIGGLQILLYQAYLAYAALGIAALIVIAWKRTAHRRQHVLHLAGVVLVAFAVSSWYLVPYLAWRVTHGVHSTAFLYPPTPCSTSVGIQCSGGSVADLFPFVAVSPIGILTLVGLFGVVWYRRRSWWATPLLLMALGAYVYRFGAELIFIHSGSTYLFQYATRSVTATLAAGGVLTLARAGPALVGAFREVIPTRNGTAPTELGTLALGVLAIFAATTLWYAWIPGAPTPQTSTFNPALTSAYNAASAAFQQPLPDGRYPRFAPVAGRLPWFPIDPILDDVHSVLGPRAAPVTLSWNEQIFAIEPWPGYIGVGAKAAAGTSNWPARFSALKSLSHVTSPGAFARASAHTPFGRIDVFVLQRMRSVWAWTPVDWPGVVDFAPRQFASQAFAVFQNLPDATVVAVRRRT